MKLHGHFIKHNAKLGLNWTSIVPEGFGGGAFYTAALLEAATKADKIKQGMGY